MACKGTLFSWSLRGDMAASGRYAYGRRCRQPALSFWCCHHHYHRSQWGERVLPRSQSSYRTFSSNPALSYRTLPTRPPFTCTARMKHTKRTRVVYPSSVLSSNLHSLVRQIEISESKMRLAQTSQKESKTREISDSFLTRRRRQRYDMIMIDHRSNSDRSRTPTTTATK